MEANIYTSYTETESESSSSESESEDNYINMEPGRDSSSSSFFQSFLINNNNNNNKEFEFQSFSNSSSDRHATTSPADDLFYMGKLLPLHLPSRLLHHQIPNNKQEEEEEEYSSLGGGRGTPLFSTPTANTPFQSCNISPAESCHVSRELNPAEYFADYNNNNNNNNNNLSPELLGQQMKKSRPPKQQTKNSNSSSSSIGIGSKLKWAYLKSLFTTSGCAAVDRSQHLPKVKHYSHKSSANVNTHAPPPPPPPAFGQIKSKQKKSSSDYNNNIAKKENTNNNLVEGHHHHHHYNRHRRSFSGAFKRISKTKKSSSSTNSGTADSKRCVGGSSSEINDSSIQAAIAHCKRSQKVDKERAFCSISASYI